jgi:hypothetical protein
LPQRTAHWGRRAHQHASGSPAPHQNARSDNIVIINSS